LRNSLPREARGLDASSKADRLKGLLKFVQAINYYRAGNAGVPACPRPI